MNISRNHNKGPKHKHWDLTSKLVLEPVEVTGSKIHTQGPQSLTNLSLTLTTSEACTSLSSGSGERVKGKGRSDKRTVFLFPQWIYHSRCKKQKNMPRVITLSKAAVEESSTECTRGGRLAASLNHVVHL